MTGTPDLLVSAKELFAIDSHLKVPAFSRRDEHVPEIDTAYQFNEDTTLAILAGFIHNRRVLIQGMHGTGKSSHIEQVAARLNWPCVRINLDGHISRLDLIGKDVVRLRENKQVTEFQEGLLPWSLQRPTALVFDELDAARPEVLFVLQRLLEHEGKLTLVNQNQVLTPHSHFRLFATANTVGLGNLNGLYHGTFMMNQAQIDRWSIVTKLDYLEIEAEQNIVLNRVPLLDDEEGQKIVAAMVSIANLTRKGFHSGDISTLMSPRTVIFWAENYIIFKDIVQSFRLSFLNKCDEAELPIFAEYFQRCFDRELYQDDPYTNNSLES